MSRVVAVIIAMGMMAGSVLADLVNGGFGIATNGNTDIVGWTGAHGGQWNTDGGGASTESWRSMPGAETNEYEMHAWGSEGGDAGLWQEVTNDLGGASVWTASLWMWNDATFTNVTTEMKIEFYSGDFGAPLQTTTLAITKPGETWTQFSVISTAPVNAAWSRVVIYSGDMGTSGALQFDSVSLTAVPEPGVAALFGFGALALWMRRRTAK